MKMLGALVVGILAAIGAVAVGLFLLRKKQGSWDSVATSARETATSWGGSAADQASHAADKVAESAGDATEATRAVADQVKSKIGKSD